MSHFSDSFQQKKTDTLKHWFHYLAIQSQFVGAALSCSCTAVIDDKPVFSLAY